jgi:hypothetical protein
MHYGLQHKCFSTLKLDKSISKISTVDISLDLYTDDAQLYCHSPKDDIVQGVPKMNEILDRIGASN